MMLRVLLVMLMVPALLAPVRLKDSTPGFFSPPAQGPAPESYSLPAAEPLVTPTVIQVTPTLVQPSATELLVVSGTLALPLPPSVTVVPTPTVIIREVPAPANRMSEMEAALCLQALNLVQELSMLSYQQKRSEVVMRLSLASSAAMAQVEELEWPVMTAFGNAARGLPMFQPQKTELKDGAQAALTLCVKPGGNGAVSLPRPD